MIDLIKPTGILSDYNVMIASSNEIVNTVGWGDKNQIGLTSRIHGDWRDAVGSLYDRNTKTYSASERDFQFFNSIPLDIKNELLRLKELTGINFGRIRLMNLLPKTGLSVHKDSESRYHYVLKTNSRAYFCFNKSLDNDPDCQAVCYHIPCDGQWYHCDTRQTHWVYNGGDTDRIHLVVNVA